MFKFTKELNRALVSFISDVEKQNYEFGTPEHFFYYLLFDKNVVQLLKFLNVNIDEMKLNLKKYFEDNVPRTRKEATPVFSDGFQRLLEDAVKKLRNSNRTLLKTTDMIVALYDLENSFASKLLKSEGVSRYDLLMVVSHGKDSIAGGERKEENFALDAVNDFNELEDGLSEADEEYEDDDYEEEEDENFLEELCVDLTEKARNGEFDPIIGREKILERTMQVLLRRKKNNPIHVGEPGVGKTAITEGLATLIVEGRVPKGLLNHKILSLDLAQLLANTKYRGDFERKMKQLIAALSKEKDLIVFIDEIHNLVGAGGSGFSNSLDAANILKPILNDGTIKFIGATTYDEYRKCFEKEGALSRRFQKIDVPEPTKEESLEILKGVAPKYEAFYKIKYSDEALKAAVELSSKYIFDRFLPDKAIDLIDEAGALNSMNSKRRRVIDSEFIERVAAILTGKREGDVSLDNLQLLKNLESEIKSELFGQEEAVKAVVTAVKKSFAGFSSPEKPIASFLFAGPTGVGKTELARILAKKLDLPLHRFDMSEYQEKHTVARLFGAPPGYVGYEEGGLLTEAIRRQPASVLLLDEIEKAHSDIYNSLLQIMDYATLTDSSGRKANFKNTIIIMTSNAGAREIGKKQTGFGERTFQKNALAEAVKNSFSPEFRNRLDAIVYFSNLNPSVIGDIVKKEIKALALRLAEKNITLTVTQEACKYLAEIGFSQEFGARETVRIVEEKMQNLLLDELLFAKSKRGAEVSVGLKKRELVVLKRG